MNRTIRWGIFTNCLIRSYIAGIYWTLVTAGYLARELWTEGRPRLHGEDIHKQALAIRATEVVGRLDDVGMAVAHLVQRLTDGGIGFGALQIQALGQIGSRRLNEFQQVLLGYLHP